MVAVLTLWVSSPALACLVQPEKMTEAEMQCCREMAGHCGEMAKAEHSCCPKTPAKIETSKKVVLAANDKVTVVAPLLIAQSIAMPLAVPRVEGSPTDRIHAAESPPGAFTPLRI
jgi:hypothetical protein